MGFELEIEMIRDAHELDMLTTPYAFDSDQAAKLAAAGADIVVAHMGLTTQGSIGAATAKTLEDSAKLVRDIADAAKGVRDEVIILCHGGPIALPDDAKFIFEHVEAVDGFYGASSMERLPTEVAITEQIRAFKALTF